MSADPATRGDKIRAAAFILVLPVLLLALAAFSMWNGSGDLW